MPDSQPLPRLSAAGMKSGDAIEMYVIASNEGWEWVSATVLETEPLRIRWWDGEEKAWTREGARIPMIRTPPEPPEPPQPPTFVSGGKRLNFDRHVPDGFGALSDTFIGEGKSDGCVPSCSWEELCAMAKLIVEHPAFRLPDETDDFYPPRIDDAR